MSTSEYSSHDNKLSLASTRCGICQSLSPRSRLGMKESIKDLEDSAKECKTCKLLLDCIEPFRKKTHVYVYITPAYADRGICVIELTNQDNDDNSRYEAYISPHSQVEWSMFPTSPNCREVSTDSSSDECLRIAQDWILNCCSTHTSCKYEVSNLPRRVIRVGNHGDTPLLQFSNGQVGKYAALSHCWGGDILQKTTSHNVDSREKNGLNLDDLPKNFQDAIFITRKLGLEYLWIDSLCIVQDSEDDWKFHVAVMAAVYRNAYIAIAADGAVSSDKGCFMIHDTREAKIPIGNDTCIHIRPYRLPKGLNRTADWDYRGSSYAPCHSWSFDETEAASTPLESRAWVFQERALSRRTLHFTDDELVFECCEMICCECRIQPLMYRSSDPSFKKVAVNPSASLPPVGPELYQQSFLGWTRIIQQYSARSITVATDKLPALAGIVGEFEAQFKLSGGYKAGLWEQHMPLALLWHTMKGANSTAKFRKGHLRYPQYVAPTWSWASLSCPVRQTYLGNSKPPLLLATLDHLDVKPKDPISNPYGAVSHGSIGFDSLLIELITNWESPNGSPGYLRCALAETKVQVAPETMSELNYSIQFIDYDVFNSSELPAEVPIGSKVYLMPIALYPSQYDHWQYYRGLILQLQETDVYKRVGTFYIFCNSTLWETWESIARHGKITIV